MKSYQERLITERNELGEKLVKLKEFIVSLQFKSLPEEDRALLDDQCIVMKEYSRILDSRILRINIKRVTNE